MFYSSRSPLAGRGGILTKRQREGLIGENEQARVKLLDVSDEGDRKTFKRNLYLVWTCTLILLITIHSLTRPPADFFEEEVDIAAPYETLKRGQKSAKWMLSHAHRVQDKLTANIMQKLGVAEQKNPADNSLPHPRIETPEFQEQMYKLTTQNWESYQAILTDFARKGLGKRLSDWAVSCLRSRGRPRVGHDAIPSQIWQTGKDLSDAHPSFVDKNKQSGYNFMDDSLIESWTSHHFNGTQVYEAWSSMERIVLKADLWRYLAMYIEGGYYSDTDTECLKPVRDWGNIDAVVWHIDDPIAQRAAKGPPLVVVGIEVDVPDVTGWEQFWTRPIQIVQWTFASEPGHPIFLDAIRRVVNSMGVVSTWQKQRNEQAGALLETILKPTRLQDRRKAMQDLHIWDQLKALLLTDPFDKDGGGSMSLIEATGPGIFSDAVFSYLWTRYGIHWSQLHNIQTTTRIGEVAIVPITAFAPFERPDWKRWKGITSGPMASVGDVTHPQALVNHHFSGSWRTEKDDVL